MVSITAAGKSEASERTGYDVVHVSFIACTKSVLGPSRFLLQSL